MIGRDDLTCAELESFLENAMMAGRSDDGSLEQSFATMPSDRSFPNSTFPTSKKPEAEYAGADPGVAPITEISQPATIVPPLHDDPEVSMDDYLSPLHNDIAAQQHVPQTSLNIPDAPYYLKDKSSLTPLDEADDQSEDQSEEEDNSLDRSDLFRRVMARKKFWSIVAIGSFSFGIACLAYAFRRDERPQRRWSSTRR